MICAWVEVDVTSSSQTDESRLVFAKKQNKNSFFEGKKGQKHTAPGIRWSSPIQRLCLLLSWSGSLAAVPGVAGCRPPPKLNSLLHRNTRISFFNSVMHNTSSPTALSVGVAGPPPGCATCQPRPRHHARPPTPRCNLWWPAASFLSSDQSARSR